jgi:hypothetical protein
MTGICHTQGAVRDLQFDSKGSVFERETWEPGNMGAS